MEWVYVRIELHPSKQKFDLGLLSIDVRYCNCETYNYSFQTHCQHIIQECK